jgi:prepilin-type N-terminal cleavage/methylation domain-containing protein
MEDIMSAQKLKKGFTLIELMVVIVIIGILAAIAIPKLFGMSAKAKAQEVGPAVGTWTKLQLAYKMETGNYGGPKDISYILPNASGDDLSSETGNFKYTATGDAATPTWKAESKFNADGCAEKSEWGAKFVKENDVPQMRIDPTKAEDKGCLSLTPNYLKIGCVDAASKEKGKSDDKKCDSKE